MSEPAFDRDPPRQADTVILPPIQAPLAVRPSGWTDVGRVRPAHPRTE